MMPEYELDYACDLHIYLTYLVESSHFIYLTQHSAARYGRYWHGKRIALLYICIPYPILVYPYIYSYIHKYISSMLLVVLVHNKGFGFCILFVVSIRIGLYYCSNNSEIPHTYILLQQVSANQPNPHQNFGVSPS